MGIQEYSNETKSVPTICIVGAGFSGLLAGVKLKTELGFTNYVMFDENTEVGGTWLVNTYPGCACDVESHLYSYSFEPNPYWSYNFSPQEEIWQYLRNVAKKYDLYKNIKFNSQIKSLVWDELKSKWRVQVYNKVDKKTEELFFDLIINSPGALRVPNIPEEFNAFKGPMVHTGAWDTSVEFDDKIVAVIGSGSSAIQLIPELASKAKQLHCYQRKPAWVMPRRQFKYPKLVQNLFAFLPLIMILYRWFLFLSHELFYPVFLHAARLGRFATWLSKRHAKKQIPKHDKLREDLIPDYRIGCKRIIISNEYFPAMQRSNVKLHRDQIIQVKPHSLVTTNGEQNVEVLILGTGFRVQDFFAPMKIIGKNDVLKAWKMFKPISYLGITTSVSPNQFILLGPNTGLGHNTIIFMIECQMNYIIQLITEMIKRNAKVIEVKESAEKEFHDNLDRQMKKTVWGKEKCGSWYGDKQGNITTIWPWNCIDYWRATRVADFTKFEFY